MSIQHIAIPNDLLEIVESFIPIKGQLNVNYQLLTKLLIESLGHYHLLVGYIHFEGLPWLITHGYVRVVVELNVVKMTELHCFCHLFH